MRTVKVACHVHSTWSYDGHWSLARIAATFRRLRYDAVLVCEHDRGFSAQQQAEHREACERHSDGILLVPGVEYADPDNVVHVPVWGPVPFLGEGRATGGLLEEVRAHGGVALLAHPGRRDAWQRVDPAWFPLLSGVELWSRKYDGWAPNRLLASGGHGDLPAYASLDLHRRRQLAPLAMQLELPGEPTDGDVVEAMLRRRVRATVLGRPMDRFRHGAPARAARTVEACRRPVAGLASRLLP